MTHKGPNGRHLTVIGARQGLASTCSPPQLCCRVNLCMVASEDKLTINLCEASSNTGMAVAFASGDFTCTETTDMVVRLVLCTSAASVVDLRLKEPEWYVRLNPRSQPLQWASNSSETIQENQPFSGSCAEGIVRRKQIRLASRAKACDGDSFRKLYSMIFLQESITAM